MTDYYPFGLAMDGRTEQDSSYRYGFNAQEKVDEIKGPGNHYTAEFWEYDPKVVHRWNLDPRPNPSSSSYAILQGSPIWYSDHLGDTIKIAGTGGFINYSPGMKHEGENDFASSTINTLNEIFEKDGGETVLSRLSNSNNVYSILDEGGGAGTASFGFQKGENGGGKIKAGSILGLENLSRVEKLGHELFHGYQFERGQDPYTINSEVGANLFGQSLVAGFGGMAPGQDPVATTKYHDASIELLLSTEFDIKQYQQAVSNFKMGSSKNLPNNKYPNGPYSQFPIVNLKKPIISEFFPLLKD